MNDLYKKMNDWSASRDEKKIRIGRYSQKKKENNIELKSYFLIIRE